MQRVFVCLHAAAVCWWAWGGLSANRAWAPRHSHHPRDECVWGAECCLCCARLAAWLCCCCMLHALLCMRDCGSGAQDCLKPTCCCACVCVCVSSHAQSPLPEHCGGVLCARCLHPHLLPSRSQDSACMSWVGCTPFSCFLLLATTWCVCFPACTMPL